MCVPKSTQNISSGKETNKKMSDTVDCRDIDGLVKELFGKPPGPACSIILDFDNTAADEDPRRAIFRTLGQILTRGLLLKHGHEMQLQHLTPTEIQEMKDYMRSVGFDVLMNEEIYSKGPQILPNRLIPWVLSIRHPPGVGPFFKIMFCHVMP